MLVTEIDEGASDWDCFASIHKEGADFGFSSGRHEIFDRSCKYQKGSVELGAIFGTEEVEPTGTTPCFGGYKVGSVTMDVEYHVTGTVSDFGVGVACGIV